MTAAIETSTRDALTQRIDAVHAAWQEVVGEMDALIGTEDRARWQRLGTRKAKLEADDKELTRQLAAME